MGVNLVIDKSSSFTSGQGWGMTIVSGREDLRIMLLIRGKKNVFDVDRLEEEERNLGEQIDDLHVNNPSNPEKEISKFVSKTYDRLSIRDESVSLCVVLTKSNEMFLASIGEIGAYVFREGRFAKLILRSWPITFLRGEIKNEDIILVSAEELFGFVAPGRINNIILAEKGNTKLGGFVTSELLQNNAQVPYLLIETEMIHKKVPTQDTPVHYRINDNRHVENDKLSDKLLAFSVGLKNFFPGRSIDPESYSKRNKSAALLGIILLIILIVSISFGVKKRKQQDFKNSYISVLTTAQHSLDESLNIFTLNKNRSRELFLESKNLMLKLIGEGIEDPQLANLKEDIEKNQGKVLGEYEVSPQNFVDLGLVTDDFNGDKMMLSGGSVYVVDKQSRKIIKLSLSTKRSEVLLNPNKIDEIYDTTSYVEKVFVFNKEGIFEVDGAKKKLLDAPLGSNILTGSFAGNLYLLDKLNSKIFRYSGDGGVFGSGKEWLSDDVVLNLGNAKSMQIDGSIWILLNGNKMYRFTQGNQQNFQLDDNYSEGINMDNIFVSDESEGLYVLDGQNGRIYVFDKSGGYISQYIADAIKGSVSLVVSENDKKMIVLNGDKILSIELKHLEN